MQRQKLLKFIFEQELKKNKNIPLDFKKEYKFHPIRKWRIDYCWIKEKLAVELEGGIWTYGRHNRAGGFIKDMEKYNTLTLKGFYLLRVTYTDIENKTALETIKKFFNNYKKRLKNEIYKKNNKCNCCNCES